MRLLSLAAAPIAFFFPSPSKHINIGKLALLGMVFTTFFLFTSGYHFPGGACHYPNWAEAIVHGDKLPPTVAQREVFFPLLYILSGFTFTHSFIGLTLILAIFATLMSVLVYWCLEKFSPSIAFFTGLACILSLAPFTYIKFFYPDQAYMFFNLLTCALLIKFIQSKNKYRYLYFFTLAAIAASFTRTAGNLVFPVLLVIAFFSVRGQLRHYLACTLIFAAAAGLYQWHRYEIFDMKHQVTKPSGTGMQTFYPIYLYFGDYGLKLSSELGPTTQRLEERLREELGTNVRNSAFAKRILPDTPKEFKEKYIYSYSPEQLIDKIFTKPNEEYFYIILEVAGTDDKFLLNLSKEIALAHPWYIVQYSMRNLRHALFKPGYATPRYTTIGYIKVGIDFMPATQGWGVRSEDTVTQYGPRAAKEMQYLPLETAPTFVQKIFSDIKKIYLRSFKNYLRFTNTFIIAAWIAAILGTLSWLFSRTYFFQTLKNAGINKLTSPIIAASIFVVYEALMTSVFCQPVYRYFHLTEALRMIIVGLGLIFVAMIVPLILRNGNGIVQATNNFIFKMQKYDYVNKNFSNRPRLWLLLLISLNIILFAWWVVSMLIHTSP